MKVYVPLNEQGINELNLSSEINSNNLKIIEFTGDDYFFLEEKKYIDILNAECNCIIDLYEDEDITTENLNKAREITQIIIKNTSDKKYINLLKKFIDIFDLAIKSNTYVNIYCYGYKN